jgi:uncharacterized protein (TIGR04255 family)
MPRPKDLPNFDLPPLNELVLGVQYASIPGYSTVDAGAVWELFRSEFPVVQEQPLLPPQFETFGGAQSSEIQIQFGPLAGPMRLWFVTEYGDHLLQFQPDRLLLNWRHNGSSAYPHYEKIVSVFQECLEKLDLHVKSAKGYTLDINQVEITYVNIVQFDDVTALSDWLKVVPSFEFPIEAFNLNFTEVLRDETSKPTARLHHNVRTLVSVDGRNNAFQLDMTYRGKPTHLGILGALDLLNNGRSAIVRRFTELTTKQAHDTWKRTK